MAINVPTANAKTSDKFIKIDEKDLLWEASFQINDGHPSKAALMIEFLVNTIAQKQHGNKAEQKTNESIEANLLLPIDVYKKITKDNPSLKNRMNNAIDEIVQDSFSHPAKLNDPDGEEKADKTFGRFVEQHQPKQMEEYGEVKPKGIEPINMGRRNFLKTATVGALGAITGGGVIGMILKDKPNDEKQEVLTIIDKAKDKQTGKVDWSKALIDASENYSQEIFGTMTIIGAAASGIMMITSHNRNQQDYKDDIIGEVFDAIDHRIDLELQGLDKGKQR